MPKKLFSFVVLSKLKQKKSKYVENALFFSVDKANEKKYLAFSGYFVLTVKID